MDDGIGSWPTKHASRTPERVALIDGDTGAELTWADLEARTNALAAALRSKGVRKGDRVAFCCFNSPHVLEIIFAVAKVGAVTVALNFRLSAPELNYVLTDSATTYVFASTQVIETVREACEGTVVREVTEVTTAQARRDGAPSAYEDLIAEHPSERVVTAIDEDDLSMLMYTSGTTGFPKGAMLTHGNHLWNAINNVAFSEGLTPRDVTLIMAPLFHIGALGIFTLPLAYLGGTSIVYETFSPEGWLDGVEQHRPTMGFLVPAMWGSVIAAGLDGRDLSSLRYALSGGAPCPLTFIQAVQDHGVAFIEGFGLTETAPFACVLGPDETVTHAGSVGKPVLHDELRIVDEADQDVAPGEVGELLVKGPNVFHGYWEKPEATAEALRGGWFHTGDLARCDEEGYYHIVDRKKDMVITGGENVYPSEIEQTIYQHPAVAEAAVIGVPSDRWGEAVTAVVALRPGAELTEDELIAWMRERQAGFKVPKAVHFVDALPRTATGKVLKRELRTTWADGQIVRR
ncbi:long-chain fatty acid--CoA ligase [Janibacter indicus]|uniref:Long-chain fatty acid--CoA ligase n=1 Tax=Janibacter indicus TaxID=857417 RepID=A0A7L9J413_9MICO|nr:MULTISPECIES: long-chain fatty acid--CoA ligase [Janibacter]MCW4602887.1 long-chain fatty acid--CoA ligase [Janibacter hoylei]QOK23927.1 long-chain fatty acid--CoA ligase [Janibacter indicus]